MLKKGIIVLTILFVSIFDKAQDNDSNLYYYPQSNIITNEQALYSFFTKLDSLLSKKKGKVSIVHIGDSHIQADFFSGQLRKRLQTTFGNAGRGFVFPYQIARSNGPVDISVSYDGMWSSSSIMSGDLDQQVGASGYAVYAGDSATLTIVPERFHNPTYSFNKLTVFQSNGYFEPQNNKEYLLASALGGSSTMPYSTYVLTNYIDSLNLLARSIHGQQVEFHGLVLENSEPGILYHAMGANGSSTVQYLNSNLYDKQIAALEADLVIISFGTNDCYLPYNRFCSSCAQDRFRTLIYKIRKRSPNASILITSPADHFYRRKYDNRNLWYFNRALFNLVEEENVALWDLYGIMGGERSILKWQRGGLARGDLIHFTKEGYLLQGNLLYEALINSFESRFN